MTVLEKIEAQQKGNEGTAAWMVGEQLKDICSEDPQCAEIVAEDLDNEAMSLTEAAKKIKEKADKTPRKGNCVCIPPNVAEEIIREFFGLPAANATDSCGENQTGAKDSVKRETSFLSLDSFL